MHTIESIRSRAEEFFNIDLSSKSRDAEHFRARSVFYKMCFVFTKNPSYTKIGRLVNRDHATVIYSMRTFDDNIKYDKEMKEMYSSFRDGFEVKKVIVYKHESVNLINDLMDKLDDNEKLLLSHKLEALYNLNKSKIKENKDETEERLTN